MTTADGLRDAISHVESLTNDDAIALDTEGGANFETLQMATTKLGQYVFDMRDCKKHKDLTARLGLAICQSAALRFGKPI